jgi:sugar phosphate isomerase/epimerase
VKGLLILAGAAMLAHAADTPLYVFGSGVGEAVLPIEAQAALAKKCGYAGIFYSGTAEIPRVIEAHRTQGLKLLGIYTGMNLSDAKPGYEPGLPEAIRQLLGSGSLIAFTVGGKAADGDERAAQVIGEVADLAADAGLKVALYPHFGLYMARVEDALRLREKANRPNVGIVFNLCHWLRSGDEANMAARIRQAVPHTLMVSINGADHEGDWSRLIQPLDQGSFDVYEFLRAFRTAGYRGPVGLQCYGIKIDHEENLARSMKAWRALSRRLDAGQ